MGRKKQNGEETGEGEDGLLRIMKDVAARCEAKHRKQQEDYEATWEEIRQAVARGEITREELFGQSQSKPIRLTIGTTELEIQLTATISEVPARTEPPAKPAKADVIAFRAPGVRSRRPKK